MKNPGIADQGSYPRQYMRDERGKVHAYLVADLEATRRIRSIEASRRNNDRKRIPWRWIGS
jgi:hypothetical protein